MLPVLGLKLSITYSADGGIQPRFPFPACTNLTTATIHHTHPQIQTDLRTTEISSPSLLPAPPLRHWISAVTLTHQTDFLHSQTHPGLSIQLRLRLKGNGGRVSGLPDVPSPECQGRNSLALCGLVANSLANNSKWLWRSLC